MLPELRPSDLAQQTNDALLAQQSQGSQGSSGVAKTNPIVSHDDELATTRGRAFQRALNPRTSRANTNKRLTVLQRIKSAVVKGLLVAGCVGALIGVDAYTSRSHQPPQPAKPVQLQVLLQTNQPSPAAKEAARQAGARLDTLAPKPLAAQTELLHKLDPAQPNLWRDTKPFNSDGTVNAYVEIALGSRDKYELDLEKNELRLDRVIHPSVGGYPINYGIIPGTFSWDGDPFDVVVLGPRLDNGALLKSKIIGIYHMVDEHGFDPHLVVSPVDANGRAIYTLDDAKKAEIASFVDRYKKPDAAKGKWARFIGWGDAEDGLRFTKTTAGFFDKAR